MENIAISCSKKKLSALLTGIMSKHNGGFYFLNCLHFIPLEQKGNLNRIKEYAKIKISEI